MKLRNIKTTLENLNEAIKYVVFVLSLVVIASIALFFVQVLLALNGQIYSGAFIDIGFAIILLGMTISSKGSISLRRTTLMIILGIFNTYGMTSYAFFFPTVMSYPTQVSDITSVLVVIGFVASLLNVLVLVARSIILVQYDICLNQNIDQLNKENFKSTLHQAVKGLGTSLPGLFIYGILYQGFACFINSILNMMSLAEIDVLGLIIGIVLLVLAIGFQMFSRRKLHGEYKKSLGSAAFSGFILLAAIVAIIIFAVVVPNQFYLYEFVYTAVISFIGLMLSLYVLMLNRKKPNTFDAN